MYVGLTDDPARLRVEHGNPSDWQLTGHFASESAAREWEKAQHRKGHQGGAGGAGWKYGYWYTVTTATKQ